MWIPVGNHWSGTYNRQLCKPNQNTKFFAKSHIEMLVGAFNLENHGKIVQNLISLDCCLYQWKSRYNVVLTRQNTNQSLIGNLTFRDVNKLERDITHQTRSNIDYA